MVVLISKSERINFRKLSENIIKMSEKTVSRF
jgi:hypothetical protein